MDFISLTLGSSGKTFWMNPDAIVAILEEEQEFEGHRSRCFIETSNGGSYRVQENMVSILMKIQEMERV